MADDRGFLGRGWSFPPTFDRPTGVRMLEHEADIVSSLHILLSTARGERIMVPEYGCNLDELVFENLDTRLRTLMADKIESSILYHEPRIDLEQVSVDADPEAPLDGRVLIGVTYRVRATNSRFNVVFPYYTQGEGTDIDPDTVRILPETP
ncbi:GPW/gp25 family protein [Pseudonocardia sp. DLS-67]